MSPRRWATSTYVMLALALAAGVVTLGCIDITQGGKSGGGSDASAATAPAADAGADATVAGDGCGVDGETGATLCAVTSMCPTVIVDRDLYPSCGFRIRGVQVDLLCACTGSLCPIGVFGTCAEAAALLAEQSQQTVCVQVGDGRCTTGAAQPTGGTTCDRKCLAECGGGAGCGALCGCR